MIPDKGEWPVGEIRIFEGVDHFDTASKTIKGVIAGPSEEAIKRVADKLVTDGITITDFALRDGGLKLVEEAVAKLKDDLISKMDAQVYESLVRYLTKGAAASPRPSGMPLDVKYDSVSDVLTVNTIRFAGNVFRALTETLPIGDWFKLLQRHDGVLTITKVGDAAVIRDFGTLEEPTEDE